MQPGRHALSTVGRDVSVTALATGSWDAVAKLEPCFRGLEREEDLSWSGTAGPKPIQSNLLPYIVEVVASDKPGILFQLADFSTTKHHHRSLHCSRYRAMQTGADMFSRRSPSRAGRHDIAALATTSSSSATTSTRRHHGSDEF